MGWANAHLFERELREQLHVLTISKPPVFHLYNVVGLCPCLIIFFVEALGNISGVCLNYFNNLTSFLPTLFVNLNLSNNVVPVDLQACLLFPQLESVDLWLPLVHSCLCFQIPLCPHLCLSFSNSTTQWDLFILSLDTIKNIPRLTVSPSFSSVLGSEIISQNSISQTIPPF